MNRRMTGRILFMGVRTGRDVIGYVAGPTTQLAREYSSLEDVLTVGVFKELPLRRLSAQQLLVRELRRVNELGWINAKRLGANGIVECRGTNCGGYTLEAELGVKANAAVAPDFEGWEVKQYGVTNFRNPTTSAPVTLMTPEPTGGYYREMGSAAFVRRFGYPDAARPGRFNFNARHFVCVPNQKTSLHMVLSGFDPATGRILDMSKGIELVTANGEVAASWDFTSLFRHWAKKHSLAAYVPSMSRVGGHCTQYRYGQVVALARGADFRRVLTALENRAVYYDPGIKLERVAGRERVKPRSQFRIAVRNLPQLYAQFDVVDVTAL